MIRIKNKKIIVVSAIVLLIGIGVILWNKSRSDVTSSGTQEKVVVDVQKGDIKSTVSVSGQIESANYLAVTTSVNGIVKKVYVKEGDTVTKGQKIMEITLNSEGEESRTQAWSQYLSAKTSLEKAKNEYNKLESDLINAEEAFQDEKESNSYQSHDERIAYTLAENTYNSAKTIYDLQKDVISQAESNLSKAWLTYQAQSPVIVAPGSGMIANIVVVEGMDITNSLSERTSSTVASIKNEGAPIASVNISEVDINKIKVGQKVELSLNSIDNKVFMGEVVGIDKIGSLSSGVSNYPVIVKFDEESDLVLPNMGVDAEIIIEEKKDVVYIPTAALIAEKGKTYVQVQESGAAKKTEIKIGIRTTDFTEITSGLEVGQKVILNTLPTSGFNNGNSGSQRIMMGPGAFPGR